MALIDELKERWESALNQAHAAEVHSLELYALAEDLARAIDALEAPAQHGELRSAPGAVEEVRGHLCTCHPDDAPPECQHKYAASECRAAWDAAIRECTRWDVREELAPLPDAEITVADLDKLSTKATEEERAGPEIPEGFMPWNCEAVAPIADGVVEVMFGTGSFAIGSVREFPWDGSIIAYRIITPEADPGTQHGVEAELEGYAPVVNAEAEQFPEINGSSIDWEDFEVQRESRDPIDAAVEKGAITQDEADLLAAAKAELEGSTARMFAQGMMADADRHQSDQRSIVEKIGGLFKREREDA